MFKEKLSRIALIAEAIAEVLGTQNISCFIFLFSCKQKQSTRERIILLLYTDLIVSLDSADVNVVT